MEAEREHQLTDPPATWQEHWFDHRQLLRLYHSDGHCAIYTDSGVPGGAAEPRPIQRAGPAPGLVRAADGLSSGAARAELDPGHDGEGHQRPGREQEMRHQFLTLRTHDPPRFSQKGQRSNESAGPLGTRG